jgi:hypothetical protein
MKGKAMNRAAWQGLAGVVTVVMLAPGAFAPPPKRAPQAVDYVKDLLDDYYQGRERGRFFDAAGMDGELAKEEFAAAAGKPDSFVRPYDRWESAVVLDRSRDGRLNWPEAEEYRLSVQRRVLLMFDKDKDGRLTGEERDMANAYLAGRPRITVAPTTRPGALSASIPTRTPREMEEMAKADGSTTGLFSVDEYHASFEAFREQFNQRVLIDYDEDGDGQLDEKERKAMEEGYRHKAREWEDYWEIVRWDANMNGKLDPAERQVAEKYKAEYARQWEQRRAEWIQQWDADGDGKLSPEEEQAITAHWQRALQERRRQMDANDDGVLTGDEIRAYRKKMFDEIRLRREQADSRPAAGRPKD